MKMKLFALAFFAVTSFAAVSQAETCSYFPEVGQNICGNGCRYFPEIGRVECSNLEGGSCWYFEQVGEVRCGHSCEFVPQIGEVRCD